MKRHDSTTEEQWLGNFDKDRIAHDRIAELLGFARGIAADGVLVDTELERLFSWVMVYEKQITDATTAPLIEVIKSAYHATDDIKDKKKQELLDCIDKFTGGNLELGELPKTNSLCLDNPAPKVLFWGMNFVFTGPVQPSVKTCEATVTVLNGIPKATVTRDTDFLVVAGSAHTAWKHSNGGTKIQKAMKLREDGYGVKIISEEHWKNAAREEAISKGITLPEL